MSQKSQRAQLLIEWDREWVRVHFVESAQTKEGVTLNDIEGINGKTAIVLVSRRMVLQRSLPLPDAQRGDMLIALKMRLGDVFPIPASELAFDFIPTIEKNENGRVCQVFAVRTTDIADIIGICQRFDIQIQQIVPSQAVTIKLAEQNAVSSAIFVERFGDFVNLDAYRYGDLTASKLVTLGALDTELLRMRAMTGEGTRIFSYNVKLDGTEQVLPSPYINSFFQAPLTIDLEPEEYRWARIEKGRQQRHRQAYFIFLAGLILALYTSNEYMTTNAAKAKEEAKFNSRTKQAKLITEHDESESKKMEPQALQLRKAFEPAQQPGDVLKVISSLVPKDTWLTGVTFERGKILQIRGTSKKSELVSAYVIELSKQKRFRDVRLVLVNGGDIEGIPTVTFNITAFPVGNIPMIESGKKKK